MKICAAYIAGRTCYETSMAAPRATLKRRKRKPPRRSSYHHGNLSQALIDATLELIEEIGAERVSVREAARRAGVSPGAPFRHFPSRTALMTAVAEQALARFSAEIDGSLAETPAENPLARLRAIGTAFLRWAFRNPQHFQVISSPVLIDWDASLVLRRDNERIQALALECVIDAQRQGLVRAGDPWHFVLAGRAMVYGLARMYVDRHFPRWRVPDGEVEKISQDVMDVLLEGIASGPASARSAASPPHEGG